MRTAAIRAQPTLVAAAGPRWLDELHLMDSHRINFRKREDRQMIETMERSTDSVLGYKISGDMTKSDYQTLVPAVEAAIKEQGSISLLLDMTDFKWEKVSAWSADLNFGKQFHDSIDKMAIVGNKSWEKHLTKLAQPYYAKEAQYFETDDDAWGWLTG